MAQKVRVVRTNIATTDQDLERRQQIWGRYAAIKALIRRHLPASSASTLAEPAPASTGVMDWHSDLGGQPVALSSLQGDERQRVEKLLSDRLTALRELAQRASDDPAAPDLLQAAQSPDPTQVYVLNGQPVVVGWGLSLPATGSPMASAAATAAPLATAAPAGAASHPNTPVSAAIAPASAATVAVGAASAEQSQTAPERRRSLLWLWLLLGFLGLALLIGLLIWWLYDDLEKAAEDLFPPQTNEQPAPEEETPPASDPLPEPPADPPTDPVVPPITTPEATVPEAALPETTLPGPRPSDPLAPNATLPDSTPPAPSAEEQKLRDQIAAAEAELRRRLNACPVQQVPLPTTVPDPLPPQNSQVEPPKVETPPAEPPVAEVPRETPPIPESKPTPPPQMAQQPPTPAPTPAPAPSTAPSEPQRSASACPAPRKKWEAPELVVLLDRSGSMRLRAGIPQSQVEDLYRRAARGDASALAQLNSLAGQGDNSRLGIAKGAVRGMMETLPSDVDVGLVVFGQCSGAESFKFFSANDRSRLLSLLRSITPQEGTPLARGLERAGAMVDGVSVPATVVVVTDGEDSCGGDPCAVARALKAQKPNLTINVVDVNGTGEAACMAQATGGKVYRMRSPDDLENLIKKASGETPVPPGCQ